MRQAFADGIAWGDAKAALFERIDAEVAPLREKYEALIAQPARIEEILRAGAARLREERALPTLRALRDAVGLRNLAAGADARGAGAPTRPVALPQFKQYREADGRFYFKLVQGDRVLLQSEGFDSPRDAGLRIAAIKRDGLDPADGVVASAPDVANEDVLAALAAIRAADAEKSASRAD